MRSARQAIDEQRAQIVEYVTRFFANLPDVFAEIWELGGGWSGVVVTAVSLVLFAGFLLAAPRLRDRHGWLSAIFGVMAGSIAFWWLFGIIPSAMTYFFDGVRDQFEGIVLPGPIPGMDNAYQVARDVLVIGEHGVAVVAFAVAALVIQRRFPRTLAGGEGSRPSSGGYK
ncbi:MAG: hypothetical protein ACR2KP_09020 [Egibacteraceae bacterium]